jgi:RES domain
VAALYRVFPYLAQAAAGEPGGPMYIPPQGSGRLDNPDLYAVLYLSDAAAGAIAEAFGRFPEWTPAILGGSPGLPGSVRALARYRLEDSAPVCDLDDAARLVELKLRPRRIYEQKVWAGVRWWSYYVPEWANFGLWDVRGLSVEEVRPLALDDADLIAASRAIVRPISRK